MKLSREMADPSVRRSWRKVRAGGGVRVLSCCAGTGSRKGDWVGTAADELFAYCSTLSDTSKASQR